MTKVQSDQLRYYYRNKQRKIQYQREYRARPGIREKTQAYNRAYNGRREELRKIKKYGLDNIAYEDLLLAQHGSCAICGELMDKPNIDHDHLAGKVRGLLCNNCNRGLGHFHDNPAKLLAAVSYLQRTG